MAIFVLRYTAEEDDSDDEYGKPRRKPKHQDKRLPHPNEVGRATTHTLDENLEQMMSGSFEVSFLNGADGDQQRLSPQMDVGFDFGDSEDFGLGDIGDELAKELGEGWASAPVQPKSVLSSWGEGNVHTVIPDLPWEQDSNYPSVLIRQTRT